MRRDGSRAIDLQGVRKFRGSRKVSPALPDAVIDQFPEFLKVGVNFADVNGKACLRVVLLKHAPRAVHAERATS